MNALSSNESPTRGVAFFLRGHDVAALRFAVDLAGAAVTEGEGVLLVLFEDALRAWRTHMAAGELLAADVDAVRAFGDLGAGFKVVACSGGVERQGLDPEALVHDGLVHDVLGLPAIWRKAAAMRIVVC